MIEKPTLADVLRWIISSWAMDNPTNKSARIKNDAC